VGDLILKTKRNQRVLRPICIGQDQTKKVIKCCGVQSLQMQQQLDDEVETESNIIMVGQTGTGKHW
jgi:ATP-dependent protease Clp ATPase subunit